MELDLPRLSIESDGSGVRFLTDPALEEVCGVRMGFTERVGGLSAPPYDSLDLGRFAGGGEEAAYANIHHLMSVVGAQDALLLNPKQVHGTHIVVMDEVDAQSGEAAVRAADAGADAVVVSVPDVFALLCFADCVPLVMAAPTGMFAVAHSGWRGTYGHIASKTLGALARQLVTAGVFENAVEAAAACNIYIGPYIHVECFQVGADTYQLFQDEFGSDALDADRHVDLGACIRADLVTAGADPARIADADLCTVCNVDRFFSYRAEGGICGRHGAFAFRREAFDGNR